MVHFQQSYLMVKSTSQSTVTAQDHRKSEWALPVPSSASAASIFSISAASLLPFVIGFQQQSQPNSPPMFWTRSCPHCCVPSFTAAAVARLW